MTEWSAEDVSCEVVRVVVVSWGFSVNFWLVIVVWSLL